MSEKPQMTPPATIRASSMPMALACPGSVWEAPSQLRIEHTDGDTATGTLVHQIAAEIVRQDLDHPPANMAKLIAEAEKDGEEGEVGWLALEAVKVWKELRQFFPRPEIEWPLAVSPGEGLTLTGTMDVMTFVDGQVRVLDWKTSVSGDYLDQLKTYAWLAMQDTDAEDASLSLAWLRDGRVDTLTFTRHELQAWVEDVVATIGQWDGTYHVGRQCTYCRHAATCEARRAVLRDMAAIALATPEELRSHPDTEPLVAIETYRKVKLIAKACEDYLADFKVRLATGPLIDALGVSLALVDQDREGIDPVKGLPILRASLPAKEVDASCRVSKTKALDAVAAQAPRGQKGKSKDAMLDTLRQAGALTTTTIQQIREVRELPGPSIKG